VSSLLVIGVGNPDRGDDAAGWIAAKRVADRCQGWVGGGPGKVRVCQSAGDPASLIDAWDGAEDVVVIDAVVTGGPVGTVCVVDLLRQPGFPVGRQVSSHGMGPAEAVALARSLDTLPASLTLVGIEAKSFTPGDGLSPGVLEGIEAALDLIEARHRGGS